MEQNLKSYIEELISEIQNELDEATVTGDIAGYNVPGAFSNGGSNDKKRKKKISTMFGMKLVGKIDEGMFSTLDQIKKDSVDLKSFIKNIFSDKQFKDVKSDKDFHKYLKSFYNESIVTESKDEVNPKQLANLQRDIAKINRKIKVYISKHPVTKGKLQIELGSDHPSNQGDDREITKINALLKKHTGDWRTGTMFTESKVNEAKVIDIVDRFLDVHLPDVTYLNKKPYTGLAFFMNGFNGYDSSKSDGFLIDSKTNKPLTDKKGNILRSKKHRSVELKFKNGVEQSGRFNESINEAKVQRPVNRWLELKNDDSMTANKKMAKGLKELKYQLAETEKFFNWYNKIKNINELDSDNYWKRTNKHIYKIKERLINIAKTIQEIEK
jgi:hypothetical protein